MSQMPKSESKKFSILCTFKGRGYEVLGLRQRNTCRKVPLQVNFLHDNILHCLLRVLSLYACRIVTCRDRFRSSKLQVLQKMFGLSCGNAELLHILSSQCTVSHDVFDSTFWHCSTHYLYTKEKEIFKTTMSESVVKFIVPECVTLNYNESLTR